MCVPLVAVVRRPQDCGEETLLKANDHVRCRECGYRILYKARLEETVREYTAR